jgi:polyhydroxyalkanoate synthesis regulator phasin
MAKLFKKVLYTGVGLVANTAEKVQNTIDELVKKGSLNEDEGKKVVVGGNLKKQLTTKNIQENEAISNCKIE